MNEDFKDIENLYFYDDFDDSDINKIIKIVLELETYEKRLILYYANCNNFAKTARRFNHNEYYARKKIKDIIEKIKKKIYDSGTFDN